MTTELTLRFQAAPAVLFLQTQLPARMVVDLNKYLDVPTAIPTNRQQASTQYDHRTG